jgi:hypothetical protein
MTWCQANPAGTGRVSPTLDIQPLIAVSFDPANALFEKTWTLANIKRGR